MKPMPKLKKALPFILVISCFALWGFANDITNPMVKAFSKIFRMSVTQGALVQLAFYGGYFAMAFPAALFIRRYSYKTGLLLGIGLYAVGALLFFPAASIGEFEPFLIAYFILTCGLSFMETSANPLMLTMGEPKSAAFNLNLAQSFNPIGSLCGMFVAMKFIQAKLNPMSSAERMLLDEATFETVKAADLDVLVRPYVIVGILLTIIFLLIFVTRIQTHEESVQRSLNIGQSLKKLFTNVTYREGVVAQFFYVGAQITCWTFIIQLGTDILMAEGYTEQMAEIKSQQLNIIAMVLFCCSRFISTWLMKYIRPAKMLAVYALFAAVAIVVVIMNQGRLSLYSLVATSAFMSLMFPTIYALALGNVKGDIEIGSAGLIMAILGGSVLPPVQALIIDAGHVSLSFIVPFICFVVVLIYALRNLMFNKS